MSAHTPGPWKVATEAACSEIEVFEIAEVSHFRVIPASGGWPKAGTPEDDARLIAAAPDLLAALQGVVRVADRATDEFDAARAAIAKAVQT